MSDFDTNQVEGVVDNLEHLPGRQHADHGRMEAWNGLHDTLVHLRPEHFPNELAVVASDSYSAFTLYILAGGGPISVFGNDPRRRKAKISNTGAAPIVMGSRTQVAAGAGFLIPSNTILSDIDVKQEMFVGPTANYAGVTIAVGVYIERDGG
jgi:hypothetical protein